MKAIEELEAMQAKIDSGDMPPDEPVFVLRARDLLAASTVTLWAAAARSLDVPTDRCNRAMRLAVEMRQWPVKQAPGLPETRTCAATMPFGQP